MFKKIAIILFSGLLGIFVNPEILTASDTVTLTDLDNSSIVQTVPLPEKANINFALQEETSDEQVAYYEEPYYEEYYEEAYYEPVYYAPYNSIQITGRTIEVVDVDDTSVNSGDHVSKYGDKFLYGHNSWSVFGELYNMVVGDTFTLNYNGSSNTYVVREIVVYEKNVELGRLQINGAGSYMYSVSRAKSISGITYDYALMTCYGTSFGNGDASHRLVIFANML